MTENVKHVDVLEGMRVRTSNYAEDRALKAAVVALGTYQSLQREAAGDGESFDPERDRLLNMLDEEPRPMGTEDCRAKIVGYWNCACQKCRQHAIENTLTTPASAEDIK